jgi:flagellin
MYVNTNYSSEVARGNLTKVGNDMQKTMQRLSSGLRINSAADDAAGLAIASRMTAQSNGMDQAYRNAQDGVSLVQTADSSLGTIGDILQNIRTLAVQADNGTNSTSDLTSIQNEINGLTGEIDHISSSTSFNGINLLDGSNATVTLHISDKSNDTIGVALSKSDSATLLTAAIDVTAAGGAQTAITNIDKALNSVSTQRGSLGATQNRLGYISDNLVSTKNNTDAAKSRVQDADMSAEMSNLTREQILQSTTMNMLSRANSQPQSVLQLLQG